MSMRRYWDKRCTDWVRNVTLECEGREDVIWPGGWIVDVGFDERHQAGRDGLAVRDRLDPLASVGKWGFPASYLSTRRARGRPTSTFGRRPLNPPLSVRAPSAWWAARPLEFGRRPLNPAFVICTRAERVVFGDLVPLFSTDTSIGGVSVAPPPTPPHI